MKLAILALCISMAACAQPRNPCPPLPELPRNASRVEGRVHWLTVIALYEQCAKGRQ